jgi:hypothetical protein
MTWCENRDTADSIIPFQPFQGFFNGEFIWDLHNIQDFTTFQPLWDTSDTLYLEFFFSVSEVSHNIQTHHSSDCSGRSCCEETGRERPFPWRKFAVRLDAFLVKGIPAPVTRNDHREILKWEIPKIMGFNTKIMGD